MEKVDFNKVRRRIRNRLAILTAAGITAITGAKAQENKTPEKADYKDKVETVTDSKDKKSSTDIVSRDTSVVVTETWARLTGKNVYKKGDKIPEKRDVIEKQIKNRDRAEDIYFNRGTLSKNEYHPFFGKPCFVPYDSKLPVQEITNNKVPANAGHQLEYKSSYGDNVVINSKKYLYKCTDNNRNTAEICAFEFSKGMLFIPEDYYMDGLDIDREPSTEIRNNKIIHHIPIEYEVRINVDEIPARIAKKSYGASISANTEKGKEQKKEDKKPKQPKSDMLTPEEIAIKKRYSRSK